MNTFKVHNRLFFIIVILFLSALACSLPKANSHTQPVLVPSDTNAPSDIPEEETISLSIESDLAVKEVFLRYDGATGAGTLETLICNLGTSSESHFEIEFDISGTLFRVNPQVTLDENICDSFYSTDFVFGNFPVETEGTYQVSTKVIPSGLNDPVENNQKEVELDINMLTVSIPQNLLDEYNQCMTNSTHNDCNTVISHYPSSNPHEVMKISGNYLSIAPITYEKLATATLVDNMVCTPIEEKYLGITGPDITAERIIISDYIGGYTAPGFSIYISGDEATLTEMNNQTYHWNAYLQGKCLNSHELTHYLLGAVPMPGWLNEGLATYMEAPKHSNAPDNYQAIECREAGWYGTDIEGTTREVPYENLNNYNQDSPRYYYYCTASCFWYYIEDIYGAEKVREILKKTVEYRNPKYSSCLENNDVYFIKDIVNPVLGTDISLITQTRWGIGTTFTGCE